MGRRPAPAPPSFSCRSRWCRGLGAEVLGCLGASSWSGSRY